MNSYYLNNISYNNKIAHINKKLEIFKRIKNKKQFSFNNDKNQVNDIIKTLKTKIRPVLNNSGRCRVSHKREMENLKAQDYISLFSKIYSKL